MRKESNFTKDNHSILDLTKYELSPKYLCEKCGVALLLYPQAQEQYTFSKGPFYICPRCHNITDLSINKLPQADDIKPIVVEAPTFQSVPEQKGYAQRHTKDYDFDPIFDKELYDRGCTIIDKKIQVSRDY